MTQISKIADFNSKPWPTVMVESVGELHERITQAVGNITANSVSEPARFSRQARLAAQLLPTALIELLLDFADNGNGALLLTDLEVGPLRSTPRSAAEAPADDTHMARQSATILNGLGHLVGYRAENNGALVDHIVPTKADQDRQISSGSRVEVEGCTEQCMNLRTRPEFSGYGVLRGDPNAATFVLSARELQDLLPGHAVALLREPEYLTHVDASFVRKGVPDEVRGPVPVLSGPGHDPAISYDQDLMFSRSPEHQRALDAVREVWHQHRHSVTLYPGNLLILDNSRAIHGRSVFHPQFDGGDRWVLRVRAVTNLAATRFARHLGSPVIENSGI